MAKKEKSTFRVQFHNHNKVYELYAHEVRNNEGITTANGTYTVDTGQFTGRSPKEKYFVDEPSSSENMWWGPVNRKIDNEIFQRLKIKAQQKVQ